MNSSEDYRRRQQKEIADHHAKLQRDAATPPSRPKFELDIPHANALPPTPPPFVEVVGTETEEESSRAPSGPPPVPFVIDTGPPNPYAYRDPSLIGKRLSKKQPGSRPKELSTSEKFSYVSLTLTAVAASFIVLPCLWFLALPIAVFATGLAAMASMAATRRNLQGVGISIVALVLGTAATVFFGYMVVSAQVELLEAIERTRLGI